MYWLGLETLLKDKTERFVKTYKGYDKPFRIRIELEEYKALTIPFTYGINNNAARGTSMSARTFKDFCNRAKQRR